MRLKAATNPALITLHAAVCIIKHLCSYFSSVRLDESGRYREDGSPVNLILNDRFPELTRAV
jgi:hypothetical protein